MGIQIPEEFTQEIDTAMKGLIRVINRSASSKLINKNIPKWKTLSTNWRGQSVYAPCSDEFATYLDSLESDVLVHLEQTHGLLVVLAYTQYLLANMECRKVSLAKSFDLFELITFISSNTHKLFGVMSGFKNAVNRITNNLQKLTDWSIDVEFTGASSGGQIEALKIYQKLVAFIINHKATNQAGDVVTQVCALDKTADKSNSKIPFIHKRIQTQLEEIAKAAEAAEAAEAIDKIVHLPLFSYPGSKKETLDQQQLKEMDLQIKTINTKLIAAIGGPINETIITALSDQIEAISLKKREIEKQTSIPAQFSMKLATMAIVAAPDFSKTLEEGEIEDALSALSKYAHNSDNQQWLSINFNGSNHLMSAFLATEIRDLVAYKNFETNSFYFKSQDGNIFIAIEMPEGTEGSKITFDEILGSNGVTVQVYISPDLIRKRIGALKTRKQALAEVLIVAESEARKANKFVDSDTESDGSLSSTEVRAEAREANKFVDSDTESDGSLSSTEVRAEAAEAAEADKDVFYDAVEEAPADGANEDEDEEFFYDAVEEVKATEADKDVFYDAEEEAGATEQQERANQRAEAAEQRITNAPAPARAAEVPTPAPTLETKAEATEQQERANQRAEVAEQRITNAPAPAALAAESAKTNPTMITGSIAFGLITVGLMIAGFFTGGVGFILGAAVAAYISGLCGSETASNSQTSLPSFR